MIGELNLKTENRRNCKAWFQTRSAYYRQTTTALPRRTPDIIRPCEGSTGRKISPVHMHDLEELMRICDAITVLRDGKVVDTLEKGEISIDKMRMLMVGRELTGSYYRADFDGSCGREVVLEARQITTNVLENFDLELHKGEILGIGGLADCGMHELGRILFGIDRPITGKVVLKRNNVSIDNPITAIKNKMAYVSKDRDREAIILNARLKTILQFHLFDFLAGRLALSRSARKKSWPGNRSRPCKLNAATKNKCVQACRGETSRKLYLQNGLP